MEDPRSCKRIGFGAHAGAFARIVLHRDHTAGLEKSHRSKDVKSKSKLNLRSFRARKGKNQLQKRLQMAL